MLIGFSQVSVILFLGQIALSSEATAIGQEALEPTVPVARAVEPQGSAPAQAVQIPEGLSPKDWTNIREAHVAARHSAYPIDGGYEARNPGQRWVTVFDGRGFLAKPDAGEWTWGLELESYGFAGTEQEVTGPELVSAEGGSVTYKWDAVLEEWHINDTRGLEHGYTLQQRPPQEAQAEVGRLTFNIAVRGDLDPLVSSNGRDVRFLDKGCAVVLTYAGLSVLDAEGRELDASFSSHGNSLRLSVDERNAQYPLTIDPLAQLAYLKASNTDAQDSFGSCIAMSGSTIVVGAPGEDSSAVGVDGDQGDNSADLAGAAYVFVRVGTTWSQQAYLKASNTGSGDRFGGSVAISGDTVVVGAPWEDGVATDSGAAYVFVRAGAAWSQQAILKASNPDTGDWFAGSVAVSGDTVVVGAHRERSAATGVNGDDSDNSFNWAGAAYVFVRSGTTWSQQAYLKASNTGFDDYFGWSVSVSGETVVVGAIREESDADGVNGDENDNSANDAGAAYVFVRNGTDWTQEAYLKASNSDEKDEFGFSITLSGEIVVVGAHHEESNATGVDGDQGNNSLDWAGAAYIFARSGTSWVQEAYLKASNTEAYDLFGESVAVSGDSVVVGSSFEDSAATGLDGDQADNSSANSGAAYTFRRASATWTQDAYLKASNNGVGDLFGGSVAISGRDVLVCAANEDSAATGVNGDQGDNGASSAGAVYIFGPGPAPPPGVPFCFGDGSGWPCPCVNDNDSSIAAGESGCASSSSAGGASLDSSGTASVLAADLVLTVEGLVPNQPGLYFQGSLAINSGLGAPFGDGLRCVGGSVVRLGVTTSDMGGLSSSAGMAIALLGGAAAGDTRYYQYWYRDPGGSPCGNGYNLTNGVEVIWGP